jgi:hypothetical protein
VSASLMLVQPPRNRLRATRASPPGLALSDPSRRATYGAALQQFDDLIDAASAIGPVSRPLPLYYAVHQAGKAIAAAWAEDNWRTRGHGLTEHVQHRDGEQDEPSEWQSDILRFRVKPQIRPGVFGTVATTLGTARLTRSAEIGALWSALPRVSPPTGAISWPLALPVYPLSYDYDTDVPSWVSVCLRGQPLEDPNAINRLLATYPDAAGARATTYQGNLQLKPTPWGPGVGVMLPKDDVQEWHGEPPPEELFGSHIHNRAPEYPSAKEHWLIPLVGDGSDRLPPVLLWWVLLFGLSLLARYEPAAWRAALDLDKSRVADPLTKLLDDALVIVPDQLFEAATQDR